MAKRIASDLKLPIFDLDQIGLDQQKDGRPTDAMSAEVIRVAALGQWVTEGTYMGWALPLFDRATCVVWLDVAWRTASYRIISRHIKATVARNNRFPGWRRLYEFWRWSSRYYNDRNPPGLNMWGVPMTRAEARSLLEPYREKLIICRSRADIVDLTKRFSR
ncbi:MAG: hypothetical protein HY261_04055 [Chloroflexi bacterium]|nr:hypothetical protein [Chloroflexota bacterium]